MKKKIREKNKLPLTFKYVEFSKSKIIVKSKSNLTFFVECEKYQTEYLFRSKPYKSITRLL
ncbi:hypothetical protein ASG22_04200 [Chryseobacterium sp. Leaf405]|nr:hypothetical protein ASG22_04200 [Chryseobacterium sp. Leaf405]